MFKTMNTVNLRRYISACHAAREYGSYFEAACKELNDRI